MQSEQLNVLIARRDVLDAQIKEAKVRETAQAFATVESALASVGITRAEAAAYFAAKPSGAKVAPKYRHVATGTTWTGRGKTPTWYTLAALGAGEIEHLTTAKG